MGGAYGFTLAGLERTPTALVEAADWPVLELERVVGAVDPQASVIASDRAEIELVADGHLSMSRAPLRATFTTAERLSDDALLHPYLAPAAAIAAYWLGREAFHAGAVMLDGGVWAILGEKESGKSSLLAALERAGHPVLADDALILEGTTAFAGPRSIDLRAEPARELGLGEPRGIVGDRERWRLELGPVAGTGRLRGWVFLAWSDHTAVVPVAGAARLARLLRQRVVKGLPPPDPRQMLELSSLPAVEFRRPRQWSQLDKAGSLLVEALAGA